MHDYVWRAVFLANVKYSYKAAKLKKKQEILCMIPQKAMLNSSMKVVWSK